LAYRDSHLLRTSDFRLQTPQSTRSFTAFIFVIASLFYYFFTTELHSVARRTFTFHLAPFSFLLNVLSRFLPMQKYPPKQESLGIKNVRGGAVSILLLTCDLPKSFGTRFSKFQKIPLYVVDNLISKVI
jgi:hypothetical protein